MMVPPRGPAALMVRAARRTPCNAARRLTSITRCQPLSSASSRKLPAVHRQTFTELEKAHLKLCGDEFCCLCRRTFTRTW